MGHTTMIDCPQCGLSATAFVAEVCPRCALLHGSGADWSEGEIEPGAVPGYRLREKIGEGAMGEVFLADQISPVPREVALKRLKPGHDGEEWLRRFSYELEALSLLDHRDVATVYDAGVARDGRPFYTMELVEGLPLTLFCGRLRLTVNDRLRLFARVCAAVDYAHRRGVWHGDLKPSNILAAISPGSEPELKLIDFGVRRASLAGGNAEARMPAMFTPGYASPEARAGGGWDSRSDIYSLGVLLAELVSGQPIAPDPSAGPQMLSESFAASPHAVAMAAARAIRPRALRRLLRGDVDWIASRAAAPDPAARYSSAADLAEDIQRMLDGHPVAARPRSIGYVLGRFFLRERKRLVVGGIAAVALLSAMGAVLWHQWTVQRAHRELRRVETAAKQAMRQTQFMQELVRAIANLARAPDASARDAGIGQVMERATQLADKAGAEGDPSAAMSLLSSAASAASAFQRHDLAIAQWQKAIRWLDRSHTAADDPRRTGMEAALARTYLEAGEPDEAIQLLTTLAVPARLEPLPPGNRLDVITDLARAYFAVRDFEPAEQWAAKAVTGAETEYGPEGQPTLRATLLLGKSLTELRRYRDARTSLLRAAAGLAAAGDHLAAAEAQQWLSEVDQVLRNQEED